VYDADVLEEECDMTKGKAFLVVGHKHWGKSTTLRALTGGNRFLRTWKIGSTLFFVRRMSNDDIPDSLIELVNSLDPKTTPRVIATLCPTFNDKKAVPALLEILGTLKRKYELFFFVLRHKCDNPSVTIPDDEIDKLERYGTVEQFHPEGARAQKIAQFFKRFVLRHA
jgi:hypothetical protein